MCRCKTKVKHLSTTQAIECTYTVSMQQRQNNVEYEITGVYRTQLVAKLSPPY